MESPVFSYKKYAWTQFRNNKPALVSLFLLGIFLLIAILSPFIANEKPLYVKYKGKSFYPVFSLSNIDSVLSKNSGNYEKIQFDIADWKRMDLDKVWWALIPYSPDKSDLMNYGYVSPFGDQKFKNGDGTISVMPLRYRHWLGTNKRGEDLLSGLIHGTYISLGIGLISMGIASLLGIFLGAVAGYFGDTHLKAPKAMFYSLALGLFMAVFYGFIRRKFELSDALSNNYTDFSFQIILSLLVTFLIMLLFYFLGKIVSKSKILFFNKMVNIPLDSIVSRFIEVLISMPRLILIISIAAIAKPSLIIVMVIIGITSWTNIARLTRAEFLRVRNLDYVSAASGMGFSEFRIIFRHCLPNAIAPVFVTIAFGIASAILIESSLSFLGLGVPADTVTWGSLVNSGREHFSAWWLVTFPGLAIFVTVTIYNLLGEGLRDALDPRLKR